VTSSPSSLTPPAAGFVLSEPQLAASTILGFPCLPRPVPERTIVSLPSRGSASAATKLGIADHYSLVCFQLNICISGWHPVKGGMRDKRDNVKV
jgi:hypothetical protein